MVDAPQFDHPDRSLMVIAVATPEWRIFVKRMTCEIRLQYLCHERSTFILNVLPTRTSQQRVLNEHLNVYGLSSDTTHYIDAEGTRFIRFQAEGEVSIISRFTVDIEHVHIARHRLQERTPQDMPMNILHYVLPSRYCESDKMLDFARRQFGHLAPGYDRIERIAHWVQHNIAFEPGSTNSLSSALDILNQRRGVCRDFAHLMIALCRASNVPARFVTGMDYGADPALGPLDFHAYVEVYLDERWFIFDPTGISTPTGLVRLGTGRDAADVAFATIFGSVVSYAPVVDIFAVEDAYEGLTVPVHTSLPISTSGTLTRGLAPELVQHRVPA
jgi:transglutaminase-like putative cysteine protease